MTDIKAIYEQLLKDDNETKTRKVKPTKSKNIETFGPGIDKVVWMCDRGIGPKHRYEVMFPRGNEIEVNVRNIPKSCWCGGRVKPRTFIYQNFLTLIAEGRPIEIV